MQFIARLYHVISKLMDILGAETKHHLLHCDYMAVATKISWFLNMIGLVSTKGSSWYTIHDLSFPLAHSDSLNCTDYLQYFVKTIADSLLFVM